MDDHSIFELCRTCRYKPLDAFNLDHAYAAGADLVHFFQPAKRRDIDACSLCCAKDGGAFWEFDSFAVYSCIYHLLYHEQVLPPRNPPNPNWSHLRHLSDSWQAS